MKNAVAMLLILLSCSYAWGGTLSSDTTVIGVIPKPARAVRGEGSFTIDGKTLIVLSPSNGRMRGLCSLFTGELARQFGVKQVLFAGKRLPRTARPVRFTLVNTDDSLGSEGYRLSVKQGSIDVRAATDAGIFYAMQTILQVARPGDATGSVAIPSVDVLDVPRFHWRGMHLDVSRHFFPKEFIKKYLDILASYKINVFHWHLTDDQGWRIEIKKYPRLTEFGAWRADRGTTPWDICTPQRPGEPTTYGGFYTQDDIREIVRYAKERCITVLPEIEMPAHALAALAAYPQFSCRNLPNTVPTGHIWPDTTIFCAGNDSTFGFIQDVLTEVMGLFPGKYIHIGGDEANRTVWRSCPKCQERMKAEGLMTDGDLQSYFVKRIEKFLIAKGRRLIGWDEILEGGLAPEATVMSWRGIAGGIAAARAGHDVIMSPTSSCYFDYYQGTPEYEPLAIGGFLPAKTVYAFEAVPDSLTAEQSKYILGGQANLWTEYVLTTDRAEYMLLPRLAALAEAVWTPRDLRSWNDFAWRLSREFDRYDHLHWNNAKSVMRVRAVPSVDTTARRATMALETEMPDLTIRYTSDGSDVTGASMQYTAPLSIDKTGTLKAAPFSGDRRLADPITQRVCADHASFRDVAYANPWSPHYPAGGRFALVDNVRGAANNNDGFWQGFARQDVDVTVDLGSVVAVSSVSVGFLQNMTDHIFFPDSVAYALSADGITYTPLLPVKPAIQQNQPGVQTTDITIPCAGTTARFVRVYAKNVGTCPPWHANAGTEAWLFLDEIVVE